MDNIPGHHYKEKSVEQGRAGNVHAKGAWGQVRTREIRMGRLRATQPHTFACCSQDSASSRADSCPTHVRPRSTLSILVTTHTITCLMISKQLGHKASDSKLMLCRLAAGNATQKVRAKDWHTYDCLWLVSSAEQGSSLQCFCDV